MTRRGFARTLFSFRFVACFYALPAYFLLMVEIFRFLMYVDGTFFYRRTYAGLFFSVTA
jgi:hypothetical protein